ncbi:MAG: hypothetical protein AAGA93_21980 [Actinomycetota bacterium]
MEGRHRGVWSSTPTGESPTVAARVPGRRRATAVAAGWLLALVAALAAACTNPTRVDERGAGAGPGELRWRPTGDDVVCDGVERPVGTIEQAEAGEPVELTSPMPVELGDLTSDDDGTATLVWSCEQAEAELRWDLVATGVDSGRTVRFSLAGAPVPVEAEPLVATFVDASGDGDVVCDGLANEVVVVTGFGPGESVELDADRRGGLVDGRADRQGAASVWWECRPGDVGQVWDVAITGRESDRTITVALAGIAADLDQPLALERALDEVVCDRRTIVIATVTGLFPFEVVTFAAPGADGLRDGRADGVGHLDLRWQCGAADVGTSWRLTATATETDRSIALTFTGVAGEPSDPARVALIETPFVCDGTRRPVAEVSNLLPGEFVDFTSPQSDALREGRSTGAELTVHWQCDDEDLAGADRKVWEVTATGRESGQAATFEIVGVRP